MGLPAIRAGLKTAFETVSGIGPVLMYAPKSIPANFTLYVVRDGFEVVQAGQVRGIRWLFTARLVILWQDAAQGEVDLDALSAAIVDAIQDDPHLGTALHSGLAEIRGGSDGWFQTEGSATWYRFCDFEVAVLDKG